MRRFLYHIAFFLYFTIICKSEFISDIEESYDYVIVGGGTAGTVLANRLSSDPYISVLLLEAGSLPLRISKIPSFSMMLQHSPQDWAYTSIPQKYSCRGFKENRSSIPRGKALGGSSVINFMLFVRGNKKDYDKWAENGALGWSWDDVFPYFKRWENNKDDFIASNGYHGTDGEMPVSRTKYYTPLAQTYVDAAKELGYREGDYNGPEPESFMLAQGFINNGRRFMTYDAFLKPVEHRKNLHIATKILVTKILFDSNKRAVGIEFEQENNTRQVRVKKEVLLSAGVINTPQILMLSGIGPKDDLRKFGIPIISDLPVGQNLQDHVTTGMPFTVNDSVGLRFSDAFSSRSKKEDQISSMVVETIGFFSTKYNKETHWPDIEVMFTSATPSSDDGIFLRYAYGITDKFWENVFKPNLNADTFQCFPLIMHPESVGEVKLQSTDPHHSPLIDPNYFHKPQDIKVLIEGMKKCLEIASTDSMQRFGARPFQNIFPGCEKHALYSDDYLECMARVYTLTNYHPVGTCKMGDPRDPTTVVDPKLRVKGVTGLRVIDVSIMPTINTGHTEAPAIMIGEKGSDIILNELHQCQNPLE